MMRMFYQILDRISRFGVCTRALLQPNDQISGRLPRCDSAVAQADGRGETAAWFEVQPIGIAAGRLHLAPEVLASRPKRN